MVRSLFKGIAAAAIFFLSLPLSPKAQSFDLLWKKVDSLEQNGLPRSALDIVNQLSIKAKKEQNNAQFIKSVIFTIKLNSQFGEDLFPSMIRMLRQEIRSNPEPVRSILYSLMGEALWNYSQNQAYQVRGRTSVAGMDTDSIELMDSRLLTLHATRAYLKSLQDASSLKDIPIRTYSAIMESSSKDHTDKTIDPNLRPTLYDVLAERALDYFSGSASSSPALSANSFQVNKPVYFDHTEGFTALDFYSTDSLSKSYFALKIFQQAAIFHFNDKNPQVLVDFELTRLRYVYQNAQLIDRESLYESALRKFRDQHKTSAAPSFALAEYLNTRGNEYDPLISDAHKWHIKEALEICEQTLKQLPEQEGSKNCKILAEQIRKPEHSIIMTGVVVPGKPSPASLAWKNTETIYLKIVPVDPEEFRAQKNSGKPDELLTWLTSLKSTIAWSVRLPSDGDYQMHRTEIAIPATDPGFYVLVSSGDPQFSNKDLVISYIEFWSTLLAPVTRTMSDGGLEVYVLDRASGRALKGVEVTAFKRVYNYLSRNYENVPYGSFASDDKGFFRVPPPDDNRNNQGIYLSLSLKSDRFETGSQYLYKHDQRPPKSVTQTLFFTDRAIYRPGQTIWFKGIVTERTGEQSVIKAGHTTTVSLFDVNYQKVANLTLTTNEFGSFNGSFVAPKGVLTGQMSIGNESGGTQISVEEYKRPTFEIFWSPIEGNYRLNESVTVKGSAKAYAGAGLDGATVSWRVVRAARFPWWDWYGYRQMPVSPEFEISSGTGKTGTDGGFEVVFPAIPDLTIDPVDKPVFSYTIYLDITDLNGEIQSSETTVNIGWTSLVLGHSLKDVFNIQADSTIKISSTNLSGKATPVDVTVTIERLKPRNRILLPRQWPVPDIETLTETEFRSLFPYDPYGREGEPGARIAEENGSIVVNTGKDSIVNLLQSKNPMLKPGEYAITLTGVDPFGQPVTTKSYFTVFDPESKEMPAREIEWFVPLKTSGEPGEKAKFLIGSSEDDVRVLYEVIHRDTIISRQVLPLFDRQMILEIPILEKYRGNFTVNFLFVKNNRIFQKKATVLVPFSDKKLDISFETFRDKLNPGQKEEWKIRISGPDKKPLFAEFMATMYDASLDAFRPNNWVFGADPGLYFGYNPWRDNDAFKVKTGITFYGTYGDAGYEFRRPDRINWFGFYFPYSGFRGGEKILYRQTQSLDAPVAENMMVNEEASQKQEAEVELFTKDTEILQEPVTDKPVIASRIRKDFRETAFFYPALKTDSTGTVYLSFTAPESLTKWKMLGLAHTRDLKYSLLERELVTRQELMVFPNAPRFVRLGDTLFLSTRIMNLSENDLSGSAKILLTDPLTNTSLDHLVAGGSGTMPFTVKKGESTLVVFEIRIPSDAAVQVLQFRISAATGAFSDGEERAIPVLPNRKMVTETLPLPINGKGTFTFSFDKMRSLMSVPSKTLSNYRLTLEFASNPAWYAVQALPALNEISYKSADQVFGAFYSNSLASHIAGSDPTIQAVFESWQKLTPDALLSNLEKNEDLKSALLKETPWVLEAKNETTNKQRLGLFFEKNNLENNLRENFTLLQKMQLPNGAWAWFPDMPENRWVTQEIVTGFGKMNHLGIKSVAEDQKVMEMVRNAMEYLDEELVKDYQNIKKYSSGNMEENHLSATQVQYLYLVSFFNEASGIRHQASGYNEAFDYFLGQAKKHWLKQDLSLQAMIALSLHRLGDAATPSSIMKSLAEKAIHSKEMGMYWAGSNGFRWFEAPVETQALLIEAFDEISNDRKSVDEMNIWLLKQKQTRMWRTNRATLDACYAILLRGTGLLSTDPGITIKIGNQSIDPKKRMDNQAEAGTGYFRMSWQEISPSMSDITITKATEGIAWGGLYWQYFENLDRITEHQSPLTIEKNLFRVNNTENGPVLAPISSEDPLSLGDKVRVRVVLKTDRDLEFVHMKDMRSAGLELTEVMSGYQYKNGLGYYQAPGDLATDFFFDYLPKGVYVFEYTLKVNATGAYSNGITTAQCLYAPEFAAHSQGQRVHVSGR